ncbi:hypothetical protein ACOTHJ_14795 [Achromobacter xylosoxidans]
MTQTFKKLKPYAVVRADHSHGYGHIRVSLYDLWPSHCDAPLFTIRCQTGSTDATHKHYSYAWKYGIASSYDPLTTAQLQMGLRVMRRVDKALLKLSEDGKRPSQYPEYVLAILHAVGARSMYVQDVVNASVPRELTDLPTFDCFKDPDSVLNKLFAMLEDLNGRI